MTGTVWADGIWDADIWVVGVWAVGGVPSVFDPAWAVNSNQTLGPFTQAVVSS